MILDRLGDEVRGGRILILYRKRTKEIAIQLSSGQRGRRVSVVGGPARAIVEEPLRYRGGA